MATINGTNGSDTLNGTSGDDLIFGQGGADILAGLGGADFIDGGAGADTATYAASLAAVNVSLATGQGSGGDAEGDTLANVENLTGSAFDDTLEGSSGNNVLAGGDGTDTVSYTHAAAGVTVSLARTTAQNTGGAGSDTLSGFENLTGSHFDNTLTGSSTANTIVSFEGNDVLAGLGGADILDGGAGNDTASYAASQAAVDVSLMTGIATGGDAEGDTLLNIENLTGSAHDDVLEGNGGQKCSGGGRRKRHGILRACGGRRHRQPGADIGARHHRRRQRYAERVRKSHRFSFRQFVDRFVAGECHCQL